MLLLFGSILSLGTTGEIDAELQALQSDLD